MLLEYDDIKSRINEEPKWYTENGVPRYCDFSPKETGVYSHFAVLVEIECQVCHQLFLIGEGFDRFNLQAIWQNDEDNFRIKLEDVVKTWSFGDPPRHDCEWGGDTMTSNEVRFVEVWEAQNGIGWSRHPEYEKYSRDLI